MNKFKVSMIGLLGFSCFIVASFLAQPAIARSPLAAATQPPFADAGEDQSATPGEQITLNGTCYPGDHCLGMCDWEEDKLPASCQIVGGGGGSTGGGGACPTKFRSIDVVCDEFVRFEALLVARDLHGSEAHDTAQVRVSDEYINPPTAYAGQDKEFSVAQNAVVWGICDRGSAELISCKWQQANLPEGCYFIGSESNGDSSHLFTSMRFSCNAAASFDLTIVATDKAGVEAFDQARVTIIDPNINPPTADAGPDKFSQVGQRFNLSGTCIPGDVCLAGITNGCRWHEEDIPTACRVVGGSGGGGGGHCPTLYKGIELLCKAPVSFEIKLTAQDLTGFEAQDKVLVHVFD